MTNEEVKAESESKEPEAKKMKSEQVPQAPDGEWPEAWIMPNEVEDQKALNKLEPNRAVTPAMMRELGIAFWKMDAETYKYPVKSVPWDPKVCTFTMN